MHPKLAVNNGRFVTAHFCSANRVEDSCADIACLFCKLAVRQKISTGQIFFWLEGCKCLLRDNISGQPDGICRHQPVMVCAKIIWLDNRMFSRVGRPYCYISAAMRAQITYRCSKGTEPVKRRAKSVQRQGLHDIADQVFQLPCQI